MHMKKVAITMYTSYFLCHVITATAVQWIVVNYEMPSAHAQANRQASPHQTCYIFERPSELFEIVGIISTSTGISTYERSAYEHVIGTPR